MHSCLLLQTSSKRFFVFCPYYFSVCARAVIGQFCGPYSIVQLAEFESFPSHAPWYPQTNKKYLKLLTSFSRSALKVTNP